MFNYQSIFIFLFILLLSCNDSNNNETYNCVSSTLNDTVLDIDTRITTGALLGTRYISFYDLKTVVHIEYFNHNAELDSTVHKNSKVSLKHCTQGKEVIAILESGVSESEISAANDGNYWDKIQFIFKSPFAVSHRKDLNRIFLLARLRPAIFGEGDVAFFNLAESCVRNINTNELAFAFPKDSSEKGYLNTFNHLLAQAFITSCFSEEIADFVADAHERQHPNLILGKFSENEIADLNNGPVDNYVDILNNEWGQELGKQLKEKYYISRETTWTSELLTSYLNDMQSYFSWAFQIGFKPFRSEDEQVIKFSRKINQVMK